MKRRDAVIFDAPALAVPRRQAPDRYGPLVGRIVTKERYAAAFEKGCLLRPAINGALNTLTKDGRIARLRQRWLGTDTANLPMLRESISRSTLRRRLGRKRAQLVLPLLDDSVARFRA